MNIRTLKKVILLALFFANTASLYAQDSLRSFSALTSYMYFKNVVYTSERLSYEPGHFAAVLGFEYRARKGDGLNQIYDHSLSLAGRYYLKPLGRGFFGEINTAFIRHRLTTIEYNQKGEGTIFMPAAGLGIGFRYGKKPKGLFGEAGYRATVNLKNKTLRAPPVKLENPAYDIWGVPERTAFPYRKGETSGQFYVGLGYSF